MLLAGVFVVMLAVALAGVAVASHRKGVSMRAWAADRASPYVSPPLGDQTGLPKRP